MPSMGSRRDSIFSSSIEFAVTAFILLVISVSGNGIPQIVRDADYLLSFRSGIAADPGNVLKSWNSSHFHACNWTGVTCSQGKDRVLELDLSGKSLHGVIAPALSNLFYLAVLDLSGNFFRGRIPSELGLISRLKQLSFQSNLLEGEIPAEFGNLHQLVYLNLGSNELTVNCSRFQELELAGNNVSGELPSVVGDLSTSLLQLHLEENLIYGFIPPSISNLANLTLLNLSFNLFNGSIPSEIGRMNKLERVYLSSNLLSGHIPAAFGDIPHLGLLDLSRNKLSGTIPDSLSDLTQLRRVWLNNNQLSGTVPPSLGNCVNLEILDLSHNRIGGKIPREVAGLRSLKIYLNLSSNLLDGPLPLELSKMDMVLAIDLSSNYLTDTIPSQLGSCIALESLNLSFNLLEGPLPISIGNLPYLQVLDMSVNHLSGQIPVSIQLSSTLKLLNFSFNDFSGFVTNEGAFESLTVDSFLGNKGLCGTISGMPSCQKKRVHRFLVFTITLTLFGIFCCLVCIYGRPLVLKSRSRGSVRAFSGTEEDEEQDRNEPQFRRISYQQLVEATSGFDDSSLIGSGRFGHVYKGTLPDGTKIAVKVLDLKIDGEVTGSFKRECQVLKRTRHRNLIRIITACSRPDFKALVLPLMANGSLESHLHPSHDSGSSLSLTQVVNICGDIAEGLAYLHHHSPVQVVHCDLKPSNILLDDDMTALVSDFGIARLVKEGNGEVDSSSYLSTEGLLCGSIGYIAPEYGMGKHASTLGDVYSYGVLLLEIVIGKRPTDVIYQAGSSMREWVKSLYPYLLDPVIDQALERFPPPVAPSVSDKVWRQVVMELIELGLMCTQSSPSLRPPAIDVALEMGQLKDYLSRDVHLTIEDPSWE
ncbi:putative leucine-rich repeat receptor-like serine/threonine-protein kinase At2g24130 [Aristolochia californica]|uniref:putative leucine-rich repeat receptor-like serine/threonine-protein kinase At2g24130 n=1 Tax=Aristolochia californica TaxID=171875 RepID=UPI0035D74B57